MDSQLLVNIGVGVVLAVGGWIGRELWGAMRADIQRIQIDLPSTYLRREEFAAGTAEIVAYVPPPPTWDGIRAERNAKLVASDWMATQDRTMTQAEKTYRQALRDVPQTFGAPAEVVWP